MKMARLLVADWSMLFAVSASQWTDPEFPSDDSSLGPNHQGLQWSRAVDLNGDNEDFLWDTVSPYDVDQGGLGDCWLVSAMSSAAHHHKAVTEKFDTREINDEGKYDIWFWDIRYPTGGYQGSWVTVTIDDMIPTSNGRPYFMQARTDGELWPNLMEKAFAKFVGSYDALEGGWSSWAWQAMGVCQDIHQYWSNSQNSWDKTIIDVEQQRQGIAQGNRRAWPHRSDGTISHEDMFERLLSRPEGLLTGAACCRQNVDPEPYGLVGSHAYSILTVMHAQTASGSEKLLLIRNPWGNSFVYKGDWGPDSEKWDDNADAKEQAEHAVHKSHVQGDDGVFWMSLDDFDYFFFNVEECELVSRDQGRDEL